MGIFRFFKSRRDDSSDTAFEQRTDAVIMQTGNAPAERSANFGSAGNDFGRSVGNRLFFEKDNRGTRVIRYSQAELLWDEVEAEPNSTTYAAYVFEREIDAREALLSLSFINEASDTGNPVCSGEYVFGCYRRADGKFEAAVAGREMSREHWNETRKKFSSAGGIRGKEGMPGNRKAKMGKEPRKVVFVREYSRIDLTETNFIKIYKAPDAITAKSFLNDPEQRVTRKKYIVRVQSPDGDFYRDYFGVHEGGG